MTVRTDKVKQFLKQEISDIIRREMKDPRLGFVTVTDAEVSRDLKHARVFISVLGSAEQKAETLAVLQRASGFIRSEFGKRASMKSLPEISFRIDSGVEHGTRIFELLQQVKRDDVE